MWASSAIRWNFEPGQGEIIEQVGIDGEQEALGLSMKRFPVRGPWRRGDI